MRLLFDTHALLWWLTDDAQLPEPVRRAVANEANDVFVSAASAWEIATKQRLGKLDGIAPVAGWFIDLAAADGFVPLPITPLHALRAGAYAQEHRDPFDRMLAAQSELESMRLVTRDPAFDAFSVKTLW